jgi:glucose/arabinose dehydrogenase
MFRVILFSLLPLSFTAAASLHPAQEIIGGKKPGKQAYRVETVATGLEVPWSIIFPSRDRILVSERKGRVRLIEKGKLQTKAYFTVPDVEPSGESGLMGMTLHPDHARNGWLYLAYAYQKGGQRVRVTRYRDTGTGLAEPKVIVEDIPAAQLHAGCRVRFGPDGKLYVTTGDSFRKDLGQRLDSLAGKTLRLNDDGSVPKDNPFVGKKGARPEIFSYGHRNSQGLDWQPGSGLMFQTEHGPSIIDGPAGGDEVNIVEAGKNYGWPVIHHREKRAGMESPFLEYTPAVAPSGATFYRGDAMPGFRNDFFFCCLKGECLIRVVLDGRRFVTEERLFLRQYGRLRDVAEGPDGALYFCTSNRDGRGKSSREDDRVLRIVPAK